MWRAFPLACAIGSAVVPGLGQSLLPWQHRVYSADEAHSRDMESLFDLPWASSGGKEGELAIAAEPGPWGGKCFEFRVRIDHHNEGMYPQGWPSFEVQPKPPLDFSGYDAFQYWIRCDTQRTSSLPIRFILWTNGAGRLQEPIEAFGRGEWVQRTQRLTGVPDLDKVDRIHFFLCESDYAHGDELEFRIGGFRPVKFQREPSTLAADQAAMGLWVGERADASDSAVVVDAGTRSLPTLLVIETGAGVALQRDDVLHIRFHDVFSGRDSSVDLSLGQDVAPGSVARIATQAPIEGLPPSYYLVVADVRRAGASLLGGRVGSDDLYVRKPGETMAHTVLSIRTGMVEWVRDQLHGDIMCATRIALPHVYDPLDKATFPEFVRLHGLATGKHTEGNEAGDTGLLLAAEAFRKGGDMVRCRFAEGLVEDSFGHMIERMQAPSGGTIMWTDELADSGIGSGATHAFGTYDSNQIGEWIRPLAYGIIYYGRIPGKRPYAEYLSAACRKAADYLVAHATQDSDGLPSVLRHLTLTERPDGTVQQIAYHQEGRQCDVYLGRALAGLSYYAYAMQLLGEEVPEDWWPVLDNTVDWSARKMKPNGWFDWQCGDIVEGGCHTFLGNIYIGEGLFGCCLADKLAGRDEQAARAAEAARKAYRYVTDDCYVHGAKYDYPLEFWVGPYVYWLFTEYLDTVGPDVAFSNWLSVLDRRWSIERGWHDFLDRAPTGGCGRTESNGMLAVAILGYLGIKQMEEVRQPLRWQTGPVRPPGGAERAK